MRIYSTGETAEKLGVTRDALLGAIRFAGAPDTEQRCGGRRLFSEEDVKKLEEWFRERGKSRSSKPKFRRGRTGDGANA